MAGLLAALLLSACAPREASLAGGWPDGFEGTWTDEDGVIYCLDSDGSLGMPGQPSRAGLGWAESEGGLTLRILEAPGTEPSERRFAVRGKSAGELRLSEGGETTVWKRSRVKVGRLEGRLEPGTMVVPPSSMISVRLYGGHSTLPAAAAAAPAEPRKPLNFRIWYLEQTAAGPVSAEAAEYRGGDMVFAADGVKTELPSSDTVVMALRPAGPDDMPMPPLAPPARFEGVMKGYGPRSLVRLYLERGGFALLTDSGSSTQYAGSWMETNHGRTIEITRGSLKPLAAARTAGGGLFLSGLSSRGVRMKRSDSIPWPKDSFLIEGEISSKAGRPVFTECNSLRDLEVVPSGAGYRDLNGILGSAKHASVTVEGSIGDDGINVAGVVMLDRGGVCSVENYASVSLGGTYWRLREIDGRRVGRQEGRPDPHIILNPRGRAVGSDGCNNFFLEWRSDGGAITFKPGRATLMVCPGDDDPARSLMAVLPKVDGWAISGSRLELRTKKSIRAVFEAVEM
ncbi:MAG: META domain-containing protein [Mailhella sp.]|nr:META domain-containing protein [Mailhella sp.]